MMIVVFQVRMKPGKAEAYFDLAAKLKVQLEQHEGFLSVERFESVTTPGKYVSLSFWRDEASILRWRQHGEHALAQALGKEAIFADYRISVADIRRDYSLAERIDATWQDTGGLP